MGFDVQLLSLQTMANKKAILAIVGGEELRNEIIRSLEPELKAQKLTYGRMSLEEWLTPIDGEPRPDVVFVSNFTSVYDHVTDDDFACVEDPKKYYEWAYKMIYEAFDMDLTTTKILILECDSEEFNKTVSFATDYNRVLVIRLKKLEKDEPVEREGYTPVFVTGKEKNDESMP